MATGFRWFTGRRLFDVTINSAGLIVAAGFNYSNPSVLNGGQELFIAGFDLAGNQAFAKTFGSIDNESFFAIASDETGMIAVGQQRLAATATERGLIVRFDNNGNLLWSKVLDARNQEQLRDITYIGQGQYVATGMVTDVDNPQAYTLSFDTNGILRWSFMMGGPEYNMNRGVDSFVNPADGQTYIVLGGHWNKNAIENDNPYVAVIDQTGNFISGYEFNLGDAERTRGIAINDRGHASAAVLTSTLAAPNELVVYQFDVLTGQSRWAKQLASPDVFTDQHPIISAADGGVYTVAGVAGFGAQVSRSPTITKFSSFGNVQSGCTQVIDVNLNFQPVSFPISPLVRTLTDVVFTELNIAAAPGQALVFAETALCTP